MYDDLITEARELCKYSEEIVNQLHTERLDYELEYMPLIETIQVTSELCDALEKAEAENRWIPVGERLPEHEQNVLVYIPPEENYTATIDVSRGFMVRLPRTNVTHWQKLPQPPQKG